MARFVLLAVLASLSFAGTQPAQQMFEAVEPHMGTLVRIKLYAADTEQAKTAVRAAFDRIAELDSILSDYKPDSELNRLCQAPAGKPVRVSEDLFRVLAASQDLAEQTDGAFDVTLGPLIHLWRDARKKGRVPDEAALWAAGERSGYRKLHLDRDQRTVALGQPGMQIDLGGIAKGYAADEALEVLRRHGVESALVAVSGDIVVGDPPPGRGGWRIGVLTGGGESNEILELRNAAVSTSGDAEQYLDDGGTRYSHIIDSSTGVGLTDGATVTVVAPRGIIADGHATAASLLGAERGLEWIERQGEVEALATVRGPGRMRRTESSGFQRLVSANVAEDLRSAKGL